MRRVACALLAALALAACALLPGPREPEDVEIVLAGDAALEREDVLRRIGFLFEGFAASANPGAVVDDAAYELELACRRAGYSGASVAHELVPAAQPGARPRARFTIDAGVRTRLADLSIAGGADADAATLRALFLGAEAESDPVWYWPEMVASGLRALEAWHRARGHAEVRIEAPRIDVSADRTTASIAVSVVPGPVYRLAAVTVEAAEELDVSALSFPPADLEAAARELLGQPFDERLARTARGRIADALADRGHADAEVAERSRALADGTARLVLAIRPGPRVRIGAVSFQGAERSRASFLDARVALEPGAWYRRADERASLADLQRSGLFERAAIELVPTGRTQGRVEERDVVVELVEGPSRELFLEPGYGSYERLRISAGARQSNLFGTGRTLDLSGTVGELAQSAELELIDPWILGRNATATASLFADRRVEPSFTSREQGARLGAAFRLAPDLVLRTGWEYRISDTSDVEAEASGLDQDVDVSEIEIEPVWDTRDSFANPRSGGISRATLDVSADALGSQLEYTRVILEHSHFFPFSSRMTLGLSGRIGWIAPIGSTATIPIQERFFNGGENSVRSFRESQLGPKDANGEPIGGEAATTFSIELRRALGDSLQLGLFVDAGDVALRHQDVLRFEDVGFGVGLGLRYLLPIGPIRLDGALNPDADEGESDGAIHLSVGFSF